MAKVILWNEAPVNKLVAWRKKMLPHSKEAVVTRRTVRVKSMRLVRAKALNEIANEDWKACAYWSNYTQKPIELVRASWTVPPEPASDTFNQIIYLFPGLEDAEGRRVVQPVLIWGDGMCGKEKAWCVAGMYADSLVPADCGCTPTEVVKVSAGTVLTAFIKAKPSVDNKWKYTCGFVQYPQTYFTTPNAMTALTKVVVTLEAIAVVSQSYYPQGQNSIRFSDIKVENRDGPIAVNWQVHNNGSLGEHTVMVSQGKTSVVDLFFR